MRRTLISTGTWPVRRFTTCLEGAIPSHGAGTKHEQNLLAGRRWSASIDALLSPHAVRAQADDKKPVVVLDTSMGTITIELDKEKAPITVENFLKYVDDGFYDNLIFHRVIEQLHDPGRRVRREAAGEDRRPARQDQERVGQRLEQRRGHDRDGPHARSQLGPEPVLHQPRGQLPRLDNYEGGYAVFGKVIDGMDVVDKIAQGEDHDPHGRRWPS